MKTIGIIGGMSWHSTVEYYRLINEGINERCGGLHSAHCLIYSVDFHEVELCQREGRWDDAAIIMVRAAQALEHAGADSILIATNTMHKLAPQVEAGVTIPLLHIADATAEIIIEQGINTVGLLGTRYTMEDDFYTSRLIKRGMKVLTPASDQRTTIHRVIFDELCHGHINPTSRQEFHQIVSDLEAQGAQAIILGCTEISLLLKPEDASVPLFDTTLIHAQAAVEQALS